MPDNKKHHYVPKFYLKRFSKDCKSINLYNIKTSRKVISGNLKNQCYKNYFYGKDQIIERSLGDIEASIAGLFRYIDEVNVPAPESHEDHLLLIIFLAIQIGRTKSATDSLDEMTDKMMKIIYGPIAESDEIDLGLIKITMNNVAKMSLKFTVQSYPLLLDLKIKLLDNVSDEEFITSDNPLVMYNQFLIFRRGFGNTGFSSKGLQLFFPISSTKLLLLYDTSVYNIGKDNEPTLRIDNVKDIYEINALQMCNALENIYFLKPDFNCKALHKKCKCYLREEMSIVKSFPKVDKAKKKSAIVVSSKIDIEIPLKLSFIRIKKQALKERKVLKKPGPQPAAIIRNQQLHDDYQEFIELTDDENFNPSQFIDFIQEKYDES